MPVTISTSYTEVFKPETVEFIQELLDDNYELTDILEFVDAHSEDDLVAYYETYVEQGERVGYEVVDAFVELNGFCDVENCEDAYVGIYADGASFAEEMIEEQGGWERGLAYDYDIVEKGFRNCFIFRKYY